MDPTHFLGSQTLTHSASSDPVQDFYDTHATDPMRPLRSAFARISKLRVRPPEPARADTGFAAVHPAG